jgi:hypothetical protein
MKFSDPRTISGCQCWLRSDLGITLNGSTVSTWASQVSGVSGNASQSFAPSQPVYSAGINGRPKLAFDTARALVWSLSMTASAPKTIVVVAKLTSAGGGGYSLLTLKGGTQFSEVVVDLGGYKPICWVHDVGAAGNVNSSGIDDAMGTSSVRAILHTYNGVSSGTPSSYTATLDGVSKTVGASGPFGRLGTDQGSVGCRLSAGGGGTFPLNGDIYEIIVYNRVLTSGEQDQIWKYLKALYAL